MQPPPLPPPTPKTRSSNRPLTIILTIIFGFIALIGVLAAIFIPIIARKATEPKVVSSADGKIQFTVPGNWSEMKDLDVEANLKVGNPFAACFVIVLSESKKTLDEMNIQKHSEITRGILASNLKSSSVSKPSELVIDGRKALQCQIEGKLDDMVLVYLHTTVEDDESFHQILAWTPKTNLPRNQEKLKQVVASFKSKAGVLKKE